MPCGPYLTSLAGCESSTPTHPGRRTASCALALHYGPVFIIENDREGLEVAYAFRLANAHKDVRPAGAKRPAAATPTDDYALVSEKVKTLFDQQGINLPWEEHRGMKLEGFQNEHTVYLVSHLSERKDPG